MLDILGTWPKSFLFVDADPAIVDFWTLAFAGRLDEVADVIRSQELDGEELWRAWSTDRVPVDPVERVARWVVLQKGNFSGKPVSRGNWAWSGLAGVAVQHQAAIEAGYGERFTKSGTAGKVDAQWSGLAGYAKIHQAAIDKGFQDRVLTASTADSVDQVGAFPGRVDLMDLSTTAPEFHEGDLVTIDPPYIGTTGYGSKLDRHRLVEIAQAAHAAGARVAVHEAEPIIAGGPWRHVELERRHGAGQRTFSKQQREVLTINFDPAGRIHHSMGTTRTELAPIAGPLFD